MIIEPTVLPPGSMLCRFCEYPGGPYDQMTAVVVEDDMLMIHGWIGKPPSHRVWRAAKEQLFPHIRRVGWIRLVNGERQLRTIEFKAL